MGDGSYNPLAGQLDMLGMGELFDPNKYIGTGYNQNGIDPNAALQFPPRVAGNPWTGAPPQQPGDVGWPTDAQGRPIQPPPGTTLNTSPVAQQAPPAAAAPQQNPQQNYINQLLTSSAINALPMGTPGPGGMGAYTGLGTAMNAPELLQLQAQQRAQNAQSIPQPGPNQSALSYLQQFAQPNTTSAPGGAVGGSAPVGGGAPGGGLTWGQYTALLGNPGKVTTPGATGPQINVGQAPDITKNFLAAKSQPTPPGAGGYTNAGFFNTLRNLQGSSAT